MCNACPEGPCACECKPTEPKKPVRNREIRKVFCGICGHDLSGKRVV